MINFVLVRTSHPGNIGAAARAMRTMDQHNLTLVQPACEFPHELATAMSSNATDVLDSANVVSSVEEAVADASLILATTARPRELPVSIITPEQAARMAHANSGKTVILMGPEKTGLTKDDLKFAHHYVVIPTSDTYSSLNLAQAVQIIAYELRKVSFEPKEAPRAELATGEESERLYEHLKSTLEHIDYIDPANPKLTLPRLWHMLQKARLDSKEVNMLRGLLRQIMRKTQNLNT